MNAIDRPSKINKVGALIGEPSFADAITAIEEAEDLSSAQKRHWPTSLRQMGRYLDRPLVMIPTRIPAISVTVKGLHPARLGVNAKTFANHRANARMALLWFNRQMPDSGRKAPMGDWYRSLWEKITDRYARDMLSPFFRFLFAHGVDINNVRTSHVDAFIAHRRETSFGKVKLSQQRALVRHWNVWSQRIPDWPQIKLEEPAYPARFAGPAWDDFPDGLRRDIDAYCERIAKRHRRASGRVARPCATSTIAMRRRELIAAARTAVAAGVPLETLASLRELLRPERVEIIIEHYWRRNGERPALYTIDLASKFLALARSDPTFGEDEIAQLDDIRLCLEEYRSNGLTEKNRALVRQAVQSDVWRQVIQLGPRLMAEARSCRRSMPLRAAVTAELAVAILILIRAPVRMQNLAGIEIGMNLVRPGLAGSPYVLTFPDYDVKNRVPIEFEFDEKTTGILNEYIREHRPQLMRGTNHDYLFPGAGRSRKGSHTLSGQISDRLWKELGLKITAHQFRHAAAAIMLRADPGNYELVRRVLGHRNIATAIKFYIGLETLEANRLFGDMVTRLEEGQPLRDRRFKRGNG